MSKGIRFRTMLYAAIVSMIALASLPFYAQDYSAPSWATGAPSDATPEEQLVYGLLHDLASYTAAVMTDNMNHYWPNTNGAEYFVGSAAEWNAKYPWALKGWNGQAYLQQRLGKANTERERIIIDVFKSLGGVKYAEAAGVASFNDPGLSEDGGVFVSNNRLMKTVQTFANEPYGATKKPFIQAIASVAVKRLGNGRGLAQSPSATHPEERMLQGAEKQPRADLAGNGASIAYQRMLQIPKAEALLHAVEARGGPLFSYMTAGKNREEIEGTLSGFLIIRQNIPNDSIVIFPVGDVKSKPMGWAWGYDAGFAIFLRAHKDVANYWAPREAYQPGDTPITAAERLYERHSPSGTVRSGTICSVSWATEELNPFDQHKYISLPTNIGLINSAPWIGRDGHLFQILCFDDGQFGKSFMRIVDLSTTDMEYLPNAEGWVSSHSQN